jgi:hypothetical protein
MLSYRLLRMENAPLFQIQNAIFHFSSEAFAKKFMDQVACIEGFGVSKAIVELIHVEYGTRDGGGTGLCSAMQEVMDGYGSPSFTFQVKFM